MPALPEVDLPREGRLVELNVALAAVGGGAPCGHPSAPVALQRDDGLWVCHCWCVLEPTSCLPETYFPTSPGPVAFCDGCGCHVALVGSAWTPEALPPPADAGELSRRMMANHRFEGSGLEVAQHVPCPFCAAPDHRVIKLVDTEGLRDDRVCGRCGRSSRFEVEQTTSGIIVELVQTGGPPPPSWHASPPRREGG